MPSDVRANAVRLARRYAPRLVQRVRPWDYYPSYTYGVRQGALNARALGVPAITAIELGVAGGNGLLHLQALAPKVEAETGVHVDVVGFDLATGMPKPLDYRDLPYIWAPGYYQMDVDALTPRLTTAELVLGDITETAADWLARDPAPIGFISFDMDYYTSTRAAMDALLGATAARFLPRTVFYFDDIVGGDEAMMCDSVGELLAIREFNDEHELRRIAPIHGLQYKVRTDREWLVKTYAFHIFDHPAYNTHINRRPDQQFQLQPTWT